MEPRRSWLPEPREMKPDPGETPRRPFLLGCLLGAGVLLMVGLLLLAILVGTRGDELVQRVAHWAATNVMLQVEGPYDQATKAEYRDELAVFFDRAFRGQYPSESTKKVLDLYREALRDGQVSETELEAFMSEVRSLMKQDGHPSGTMGVAPEADPAETTD